jgi:hypothetical protein
LKFVNTSQLWLKLENNYIHFKRKPTYDCVHLEHNPLNIYQSEKCLNMNYKEMKHGFYAQHTLSVSLIVFLSYINERDFNAVSSHDSRTSGLNLTKFYIGGSCSYTVHFYITYKKASKVSIHELKI